MGRLVFGCTDIYCYNAAIKLVPPSIFRVIYASMKVFAINLPQRKDRKTHITNECAQHGIDVEIIEAVNGKNLSEEELQTQVYDWPACYLTQGEIGCALSHLAVYQRMIDEQHPVALVLEDDAVFDESINEVLQAIEALETHNTQPQVYLLTPSDYYFDSFKKPLTAHHTLNKIADAYLASSYVLNLAAAKALHTFQKPIRYEADRWIHFHQMSIAHVNCVVPAPATTNDPDKISSSLERERMAIWKDRYHYFRELKRKEMPLHKKLLRLFWRVMIELHLVKVIRKK